MLGVFASATLAAAFAVAATLKASRPREALVGFAAVGIPSGVPARVALAGAVGLEGLLALGVAAGLAAAAYAAAASLVVMSALLALALVRGRGGEPCPCFGSEGTIGARALVRNLLLGAGLVALPSLAFPLTRPQTAFAVAVTVAAAVAAWVLARRADAAPPRWVPAAGALEVVDEGPALGSRLDLIERFAHPSRLAVAVFGSAGCAVCASLGPAVARLADHPGVDVLELDERRDEDVWSALSIPGSPYAVALSPDGVVAAKGTFNTARQLESVLATAERRLGRRPTSRRAFLAGAGRLVAALAAGALVAADEADAYHFCGHTYTTGSCPHPTGLPRTDARGYPLRASDGRPVDDLGRPVDANGRPVDADGRLLRDPGGDPLPPAPRTPICRAAGMRYGIATRIDGSWYRCCGGRVRRLTDCCSHSRTRINGDAALAGYCRGGRRVFCVQYFDTSVPC